jgi:hypothetical protein
MLPSVGRFSRPTTPDPRSSPCPPRQPDRGSSDVCVPSGSSPLSPLIHFRGCRVQSWSGRFQLTSGLAELSLGRHRHGGVDRFGSSGPAPKMNPGATQPRPWGLPGRISDSATGCHPLSLTLRRSSLAPLPPVITGLCRERDPHVAPARSSADVFRIAWPSSMLSGLDFWFDES